MSSVEAACVRGFHSLAAALVPAGEVEIPAPGQIVQVRQRLYLSRRWSDRQRPGIARWSGCRASMTITRANRSRCCGSARSMRRSSPARRGSRWPGEASTRRGAQGFVHQDLSRACLAQTSDAVLLKTGSRVTEVVTGQLQAGAAHDVQQLLPHLTARGEQYAADAQKKLAERGQAESRAMREILETQKKHISETVAKHEREDTRQQLLGFAEEELRQLEANKRYWSKRLVSLAA
jgi:hypothetical protein